MTAASLIACPENQSERIDEFRVFKRIAEKEKLQVSQQEIAQRVHQMAAQHQVPVQQMAKRLEDTNGFGEIHEQLLSAKVIQLLELHARVEDVPAPAAPAS